MSSNRSKKIIIIGASSGIGREIAYIYAALGHKVVITGRRNELLDEIKLKYPNEVVSAPFDVTGNQNRKHLESIIDQIGGLDLLIYNSGFGDASSSLKWEVEDLTTRTNVNAFVEVTGIAFNYFIKQGYGQIALTSSVAALRGNSWSPAYSASKAFMSNYAEGLQMKAARLKKKITITDIRPGFVNTKMSKGEARFWVAPVQKAAKQIVHAIEKKKRVAYITKRWWLVAQFMKVLPFWLYRRIG